METTNETDTIINIIRSHSFIPAPKQDPPKTPEFSTATLSIKSRNYSSWEWITDEGQVVQDKCSLPFPIPEQLLDGDRFSLNVGGIQRVSPARIQPSIPGILILEGNRTFGRQNLPDGNWSKHECRVARGRLYYRCIPHNPALPAFLVPYNVQVEFSKHSVNQFVLFKYKEWAKGVVGPYGVLVETIGAVDNTSAYFRYLLLCKGFEYHPGQHIPRSSVDLSHKSSANSGTKTSANSGTKTSANSGTKSSAVIFSIDPEGSQDLDDAFSYSQNEDGQVVVRIYIADVVYWLDHLSCWGAMRIDKVGISTIYLPDGNRPMLPRWIADKAGSLRQENARPVVGLELRYSLETMQLESTAMFREWVTVAHNFRYESADLLAFPAYCALLEFTRRLSRGASGDVVDSHDCVEFWMTVYNRTVAKCILQQYSGTGSSGGIFRITKQLQHKERIELAEEEGAPNTARFLKYYGQIRGLYCSSADVFGTEFADEPYVHASSPLRRLVDIYNQLWIIENVIDKQSYTKFADKDRETFIIHMIENIDEINRLQSAIKRVQSECELVAYFTKKLSTTDFDSSIFTGTVVDTDERGVWVFLEECQKLVLVRSQEGQTKNRLVGETGKYQIFLFEEEEKTHRRIVAREVLDECKTFAH